jgi:hypothetical protein
MFEVSIEIRVKQSTAQETIDKILASSPPNSIYGKDAIEGTLTLAAESQVIQLAGIPTQEAFGNIDVTVGPGKADGLSSDSSSVWSQRAARSSVMFSSPR